MTRHKKLIAFIIATPWTVVVYAAYKIADFVSHLLNGGCLGH